MLKNSQIILCTLNAQYIHSAFGLRYLLANMGSLKDRTQIVEFNIKDNSLQMAEQLLELEAKIIGFGVYIWNVQETLALIRIIKQIAPHIQIILGGPEISYEWNEQEIFAHCDHIIIGEGEISLPELCQKILSGEEEKKVLFGKSPDVETLCYPYSLYSDEDIAHRVLYVEASRGCPFRCQFCLSSLDKKVRAFPLASFLVEMQRLIDRGARQFKFVDRTFNLSPKTSSRILEFFLQQNLPDLFLHFEMVPDRFPDSLREWIVRFPRGSIQFEVGIQSFNPEVTARIARRQNNEKAKENLLFLQKTGVHLHTDLIIGLPGEDILSFAEGFNTLLGLGVEEIQVGILKRLRGAPIARHTEEWNMIYRSTPPYEIIQNKSLDFKELAQLRRFARYWNIIGNSGRFNNTLVLFKESDNPFQAFFQFSSWLYQKTERTHKISYNNLLQYLQEYWIQEGIDAERILALLCKDYQKTTGKTHVPRFLTEDKKSRGTPSSSGASRQSRHLRQTR